MAVLYYENEKLNTCNSKWPIVNDCNRKFKENGFGFEITEFELARSHSSCKTCSLYSV